MVSSNSEKTGVRDNHHRGSIGEFLKEKILQGSDFELITWLVIKSGKTEG